MPTIDGTNGDDLSLSDTSDADIINGKDGNDIITFDNLNTVDDTIDQANGDAGTDTLRLLYATLSTGFTLNPPGGFGDHISNFSTVDIEYTSIERFDITTGSGGDFLVVAAGDDVVSTGGGNDYVDVGSGSNTADGGTGIDRVSANLSSDTLGISWNLAANTFSGPGSYTNFETFKAVTTGSGNDTLETSTFGVADPADIILGAGNDSMTVRSAGAYHVYGGIGSDRLVVDYSASAQAVSAFGVPGADGLDGHVDNNSGMTVDFFGIEHFSITTGNALDQLTLYSGDDFASLGGGNDTVDFGTGKNSGDGGTGIDRVTVDMSTTSTAISWNLLTNSYSGPVGTSFTNFEQFGEIRTGSGADTIVTGALSDEVFTGAGADTITVSSGTDFVFAGDGFDTLIVDYSAATAAIVTSGGDLGSGFDGSYTAGSRSVDFDGIDRIFMTAGTGSFNDTIRTGGGNDVVSAGGGDDFVDVSTGTDQADGGAGSDRIRADMSGTSAAILWNVQANTYSGPVGSNFTNFESLFEIFTGSGNDVIVTSFSTALTATASEEVVTGAGDDIVTVGGGLDIAFDNAGVDTLIVNYSANTGGVTTTDGPTFNAGLSGFSGTYSASGTGSVDFDGFDRFLITTGSGADSIYTADANDVISTGAGNDTLDGGGGNDQLDGGAGTDSMTGGFGNDTYTVDASGDQTIETSGGGIDLTLSSISWTLKTQVENLTLTGAAAINGTGNSLANTIIGNSAANTLSGGTGADTLRGGGGNDIYVVDNAGDQAIETSAGDGIDEVRTRVSSTLGDHLENLTMTTSILGDPAINGTGNALANVMTGNNAANVLDGAGGADNMAGRGGNDTYFVDNSGDVVTELSGGGTDLVRSTVSFTLGNFVENLTLDGSANVNGTGNALVNTIFGTSGSNLLNGLGGADTMRGRQGDDLYVVDNIGDKTLELAGEGIDTVQSSVALTLLANVENLVLTGASNINGAGNGLDNILTGNSGRNLLNGLAGADTMNGGDGNDIYIVDNAGDLAIESNAAAAGGIDTVQSSLSFTLGANVETLTLTGAAAIDGTGNALANNLNGNNADNVLNGAAGADTMRGGAGNDTYIVESAGDRTLESSPSGGSDTVQTGLGWTLSNNVENLVLTGAASVNGAGNALANSLVGNSGANLLNGLAGADNMLGGLGNDTYIVDNLGDQAVETSAGGGTDTVQSSVSFTLGNNVENLTLTGSADIDGTGNALANTINGNGGSNVLNGAAGADTMRGGNGDDTYIVDNAGDVVSESSAAGGVDTVQSAIAFSLGNNVENLILTGGSAVSGAGNALANALVGNSAANQLDGLAGSDTLTGGGGADGFRFTTALGATNVDEIVDFTVVDDSIVLENAVFTGLAAGALAAGEFRSGAAAADVDDRIIYDPVSGALYFDADGSGAGAQVQFATLDAGLAMTAGDFTVI